MCPVCVKNFEWSAPRLLPCLHTVCHKCLEKCAKYFKVIDNVKTVSCPICETALPLPPEGVNGFVCDPFLKHLQELNTCQNGEPKSCDYCRYDHKDVRATSRCLECQDDMCNACTGAHRRTKITRTHQVAPYEQIQNGRYHHDIRSFQQVFCRKHSEEPLTIFCFKCDQLICRECKVSKHDDHNWSELEKAALTFREQFEELLRNVKEKVPTLVEYTDHVEIYKDQVIDLKEKLVTDIQRQAEKIKGLIDQKAKRLIVQVEQVCTTESEDLKTKLADMKRHLSMLESNTKSVDTLLAFSKHDELLAIHRLLSDRLTALVYLQLNGLASKLSVSFTEGAASDQNIETIFGKVQAFTLPLGKEERMSIFEMEKNELAITSVLPNVLDVPQSQLSFQSSCKGDNRDIWPTGMAIDTDGKMAILDRDNKRVKFFDPNGKYLTDFGSTGKNGLGSPYDITFMKDGNVAITDYEFEEVKLFTTKGEYLTSIKDHFKYPRGITTNSKGQLIVVDCGLRQVIILNSLTGEIIFCISGKDKEGCDLFTDPYYVTVTNRDTIIVTDWAAPNIKVFSSDGKHLANYGTYGIRQDQVLQPYGVCTDAFGYIFVADNKNHRIHLLMPDGRFHKFLLSKQDGLWHPMALAINNSGHLVLTESLGKVKVFKYL